MLNSYILIPDLQNKYMSEFSQYCIRVMYGDKVLMGSDIEAQYRDIEGD